MSEKLSKEIKPDKDHVVSKRGEKRYEIQFTQNRSFEMKIGRRELSFTTDKRTAVISQSELDHLDFQQQRRYFSVKEV